MRRKRLFIYLLILLSLLCTTFWWFLVRTPPPTATIGYFGDNPFLCVKPAQLVRLRFSKPLPTGIDEFYKEWGKSIATSDPEAAAQTRYWADFHSPFWLPSKGATTEEVVFQVPEGIYAIFPIKYPYPKPTKGGERFELMLFIMGDKDLDRLIYRQEPLPRSGKIPCKGNVEVYYEEPSLWIRIRFWLHQKFWEYGL